MKQKTIYAYEDVKDKFVAYADTNDGYPYLAKIFETEDAAQAAITEKIANCPRECTTYVQTVKDYVVQYECSGDGYVIDDEDGGFLNRDALINWIFN